MLPRFRFLLILFAVSIVLVSPRGAPACPNCQDAIAAAGSEDDDPLRESRAFNQSIYFMVTMPYLVFGTVGFLVYRGLRAAEARARILASSTGDCTHRMPDIRSAISS